MEAVFIYILGFAGLVLTIAALWYLFQTVRIIWRYNSLMAIAAVVFGPFLHVVFYLIPKDELVRYEKAMFRRYFLSITAVAALGVFAAMTIPLFKGGNQNTMASEVSTSQPWDWDIRAENQEGVLALTNTESSDNESAELHFKAIYQAHPDADKIVDSSEFELWLQDKSLGEQNDVARILKEGTAVEVVYVFSAFKKDLKGFRDRVYQARLDKAKVLAQKGYQEKQNRELEAYKARTQRELSRQQEQYQKLSNQIVVQSPAPEQLSSLRNTGGATPTPTPIPIPIPIPTPIPTPSSIASCDGAGCWGTDGTRYNKGAGDTYFPSTGGSCQNVGGQMQCN